MDHAKGTYAHNREILAGIRVVRFDLVSRRIFFTIYYSILLDFVITYNICTTGQLRLDKIVR